MDIITRKIAQDNGLTQYFTGRPCKHGHIAPRWVSTCVCSECTATKAKEWRDSNLEHRREYRQKWCEQNPDKVKQYNINWNNKYAKEYYYNKRRSDVRSYLWYKAKNRAKQQ